VTRGGSWYDYGKYLRSAKRSVNIVPYSQSNGIGFRIVRSLQWARAWHPGFAEEILASRGM